MSRHPLLRAGLAGVLTMAVLSSSGMAFAEEPPSTDAPDTVHLQNGTHFRGRVAEIIPGDHLSVVVGGETKVVPWGDIARVGVNEQNAQAPIGPPPAPIAPRPPPAVGPRARVRVESAKGGYLYRRAPGSSAWVAACPIPCSEDLPIHDTYRVTSGGSGTSKEFELEAAEGGQVDISIDPPSTSGMALGGTLAGVGGMIAYVGLLQSADDSQRGDDHGGLVAFGVGAAAMAAGIVMFVVSARTDVLQTSSKSASAAPPASTSIRGPTWHVPKETSGTKGTMFPLLQATF